MADATEFAKFTSGGPGPIGDYCRRMKADGQTTAPWTNQALKESGAGFWGDMARQGGSVIGGGGGPTNVLAGLSWTAGASTTLSIAAGRARATATSAGTNPRIYKGPFTLVSGKTYTLTGSSYIGTAGDPLGHAVRVSADAVLTSGGAYSATSNANQVLTGQTFVASYSGDAYFGLVAVVTASGQYSEIDDAFTITTP